MDKSQSEPVRAELVVQSHVPPRPGVARVVVAQARVVVAQSSLAFLVPELFSPGVMQQRLHWPLAELMTANTSISPTGAVPRLSPVFPQHTFYAW